MRPFDHALMSSVVLPANLIVAALVAFGVLASTVEGDLRRVSKEIDPDLRRPPAGTDGPGQRGTLSVKVKGAANASGRIQVLVFSRGPPGDGPDLVARETVPASPQGSTAVFEALPHGAYAVLVLHDEDGGPAPGAPAWEGSRVVLDREALEIELPLRER
jgi:hypothetical protein